MADKIIPVMHNNWFIQEGIINKNATIANVPILRVRDLFKKKDMFPFPQRDSLHFETFKDVLGIGEKETFDLIAELKKARYLTGDKNSADQYYKITDEGQFFGEAKVIKPISIEEADNLYKSFLERIQKINGDPDYLIRVVAFMLFGSYVNREEKVAGINITLFVEQKDPDSYDEERQKKTAKVQGTDEDRRQGKGKTFRDISAYYAYPITEVFTDLKAGVKHLNLYRSHFIREKLYNWKAFNADGTLIEDTKEVQNEVTKDKQNKSVPKSVITENILIGGLVLNERKGKTSKKEIARKAIVHRQDLENKHGKILDEFTRYLRSKFPDSSFNPECLKRGCDSRIDLVQQTKEGKFIFYEIKTYPTVLLSIRMAIGQLLEYAFYPEQEITTELYIVSHLPAQEAELSYLKHIGKNTGLAIGYIHFNVETGQIEQLFPMKG